MMSSSYQIAIRLANIDDIEALENIERRSFNDTQYYLTSKRQFSYLMTKGHAEIWLAMCNQTAAGYMTILYRINTAYGRFYSMAVLEEYREKKIGKLLFNHSEKVVKDRGLKGVLLEIREDNGKLRERYNQLGYQEMSIRPNYYPDGESCIKMRKDLR